MLIYIAQAGGADGPVKIGKAKDPAARVAAMRTGCPMDMALLTYAPWHDSNERLLHWYLRDYRIRGEWFRPAPKVEYVAHKVDANQFYELMADIAHERAFFGLKGLTP